MTRTLYLECDSGISGDMVVGALLDAGASADGLRAALESLDLEGYSVVVSRKPAGALVGCDFDVVVDEAHENHDHDMEWLFGNVDAHDHGHGHDHGHDHGHVHVHRHLSDIRAIIDHASLSQNAKDIALRIFGIIAEAEAKAHGSTPEEVHFHEVGAVDSIVDVVAAAWCLDDLAIDDVVVSALAEGEGHIRSAHGILSIPVPAVANIVEAHGLVLRRAHRRAELVTPTGAAIAAALRSRESLPDEYRIVATGLGTGKRAYDPPSTLRVLLVEGVEDAQDPLNPPMWKLETEVDDCTGEALGYTLELLYEAGAREAHFVPVFMKKGRPGYQIEVLCATDKISELEQVIFENTTTIGIRRYPVERTVLPREAGVTSTPFGTVRTKRVTLPSGAVREYMEHDSVAQVAREQGVSYQDVIRSVAKGV